METPSSMFEKKLLSLPSETCFEAGALSPSFKFRKMLRDSYLSESDSSNSNSPCLAKDKKMLKPSDVYRNLIDLAKEESTDDTGCQSSIHERETKTKSSSFAKYSQEAMLRMQEQTPEGNGKADGSGGMKEIRLIADYKEPKSCNNGITGAVFEIKRKAFGDPDTSPTFKKPLEGYFEKKADPLALSFDSDLESDEDEINDDQLSAIPFRHLIFSPNCKLSKQEILRFILKIKKALSYCLFSLKPPSDSYISLKRLEIINFPNPEKNKKTLVLDLDDTLITSHCAEDDPNAIPITLVDDDGSESSLKIKLRPYLKEFLKTMSQFYEIIIFTAATMLYANTIITKIDPNGQYIKYILNRENCLKTKNGLFIKDLRLIDRDLKDVVIVDDLVQSFGFQFDNGIPIIAFKGDDNEDELIYLSNYLKKLAEVDDVRLANRKYLKLQNLLKIDIENN